MRKLDPRADKRETNEAFAAKFSRMKKKSVRRKARRERLIERETLWLVSHGISPAESEAPIA